MPTTQTYEWLDPMVALVNRREYSVIHKKIIHRVVFNPPWAVFNPPCIF